MSRRRCWPSVHGSVCMVCGADKARLRWQLLSYPLSRQWQVPVGKGWCVRRCGDVLQCRPMTGTNSGLVDARWLESGGLLVGVEREEWVVEVQFITADREPFQTRRGNGVMQVVLRNVEVGSRLLVRRRRDGDRFHARWKDKPIKLKDFLRGQKLPLHERDMVPVIEVLPPGNAGVEATGAGSSGMERIAAVFPDHVSKLFYGGDLGVASWDVAVTIRGIGVEPRG